MKEWTKEAIFYHIYPLGFCGAPQFHQEEVTHRIQKVEEWIPHLKDLHINAIYLGPVFESFEHGYDTSDYRLVDHRLGTNEDFKQVCQKLHEAGIRIVLDGVFNHVGREFWAFKDVQKNQQNSRYCGWFHNLNFGNSSPLGDPFTYEAWEGHYNLIKLNLQNEEVVQYLLESIAMWMDDFGIDGLRLDAADCIDRNFFRRLKVFCEEKNPDFWLMGEIIHGDYTMWANKEMLDSVTNYECYKGLWSSHNEKNYFEIAYSLNRQFGNGGIYKDLVLYNFADNHDVNRLASTVKDPKDLYNIYSLLYTMPGMPSIYYGSEWAIPGTKHNGSDADIRPCLKLNEKGPDTALSDHIGKLGEIKEKNHVLSHGTYEQVLVRNQQFIFARCVGNERIYTALNVSDEPFQCEIDVPYDAVIDLIHDKYIIVSNHKLIIELAPKSSAIYACAEGRDLTEFQNSLEEEPGMQDKLKEISQAKEQSIAQIKQEETTAVEEAVDPSEESSDSKENEYEQPESIIPGRYQHFKGKNYAVLYLATHSETMETYVVYRQLYGEGSVWIRPLSMFQEQVEVDGKMVPRFRYIGK